MDRKVLRCWTQMWVQENHRLQEDVGATELPLHHRGASNGGTHQHTGLLESFAFALIGCVIWDSGSGVKL